MTGVTKTPVDVVYKIVDTDYMPAVANTRDRLVDTARTYLDTVLTPLPQVPASAALYHRALDVLAR